MKRFKFGWFPRAKYKDLVFYIESTWGMNRQLFELPDNEENRAVMESLAGTPPEQGGEMREALDDIDDELAEALGEWDGVNLDTASEFGAPESLFPVYRARQKLRAILARESAEPAEEPDYTVCEDACRGTCPACTKPAEERGPEVGDLVAEHHSGVTSEGCEFWMFRRWKRSDEVPGMYTEAERRYHRFTVLMRSAEVEARIGGDPKETV